MTSTAAPRVYGLWRRQIAAARLANAYLTISGGGLLLVLMMLFLSLLAAAMRRSARLFDDESVFVLFCVLLLFALALAWCLYKARRGKAIAGTPIHRLQELSADALKEIRETLGMSSRRSIQVQVLSNDGAPLSVVRRHRTLVARFHPDVAALALLKPRSLSALLAHELTHSFQWDTWFGHIWYQVMLKASLFLCGIYLITIALLAGGAGMRMIHGEVLGKIYSWRVFALLLMGIPHE